MAGQKLPGNQLKSASTRSSQDRELERRAGIKFSGATGAVVASGSDAATTAPTYGLIDDVIKVVKGSSRPALFSTPRPSFTEAREHRGHVGYSTSTERAATSYATCTGCRWCHVR